MADFDDELEMMEEDYVFDGWREGQEYYDSVYPDEEEGIVMTETELKDVIYTRQGNSSKWDVEVLYTYPIVSKNGNIVVAKDLDGSKFSARISRDNSWNKTELGEPVKVKVIEQNIGTRVTRKKSTTNDAQGDNMMGGIGCFLIAVVFMSIILVAGGAEDTPEADGIIWVTGILAIIVYIILNSVKKKKAKNEKTVDSSDDIHEVHEDYEEHEDQDDYEEYEEHEDYEFDIENTTDGWQEESKFKKCGYSVSKKDNLSAAERHNILNNMIHQGITDRSEAISFLEWNISIRRDNPNFNNAIRKWSEDIRYLKGYVNEVEDIEYIDEVEDIEYIDEVEDIEYIDEEETPMLGIGDDPTGTKPDAFYFHGEIFEVKSYAQILTKFISLLYEIDDSIISRLAKDKYKPRNTERIYISYSQEDENQPREIGNTGIYYETKLSSKSILTFISKLLEKYGFDEDEFYVSVKEIEDGGYNDEEEKIVVGIGDDVRKTKPRSFYFNGEMFSAKNYSQILTIVMDQLYEMDDSIMSRLAREKYKARNTDRIYISYSPKDERKPREIGDTGIYYETNLNSNAIMTFISKLFDEYEYDDLFSVLIEK